MRKSLEQTQISPRCWKMYHFHYNAPHFNKSLTLNSKLFAALAVTARCEVITRFLQRWRATKCLTHINLFQQPRTLSQATHWGLYGGAAAVAEFSLCGSLSLSGSSVHVYIIDIGVLRSVRLIPYKGGVVMKKGLNFIIMYGERDLN